MSPRLTRARDIEVLRRETPYRGFFRIDRFRLRHRLFGGGLSGEIVREVFVHAPTVAVLPYDPALDSVVMIEQFRAGPFGRGAEPWLLEIVAGFVEPGESPEAVAHREAAEEAAITLTELVSIASYYPSPGSSSEYLTLYLRPRRGDKRRRHPRPPARGRRHPRHRPPLHRHPRRSPRRPHRIEPGHHRPAMVSPKPPPPAQEVDRALTPRLRLNWPGRAWPRYGGPASVQSSS